MGPVTSGLADSSDRRRADDGGLPIVFIDAETPDLD
jgi:hypothetical protein